MDNIYHPSLNPEQIAEIEHLLNSGELQKYLLKCAKIKFRFPNNATHDIDDLVSMVMIKVLEKRSEFFGKSKFTSYAFSILKFEFLNFYRATIKYNSTRTEMNVTDEDGSITELDFADKNSKSCDEFIESIEAQHYYKKFIDECFKDIPDDCKDIISDLMNGETFKELGIYSEHSEPTLRRRYKTFTQCIFGKLAANNMILEDLQ